MKKYYKVTLDNGVVGCEEEVYFISENGMRGAEQFAQDILTEYGVDNEYYAEKCDFGDWRSEEDEEAYYRDLMYDIEEITKEEYEEESGEIQS